MSVSPDDSRILLFAQPDTESGTLIKAKSRGADASHADLFDMPVQVAGSVDKNGHVRKPHVRVQKIKRKPVHRARQARQADSTVSGPLAAFIDKHGGADRLSQVLGGMPSEQRQHLVEKMAKLGGQSTADIEAMLARNESASGSDLFAVPDELAGEEPNDSTIGKDAARNDGPFGVPPGITKAQRRKLNAAAIEILDRGAPYSESDKAALRQYSGTGGVGDSLNEFYTREDVAAAMWTSMQQMGVKGDVLEPSCGTGVFLHTAPDDVRVTGVEMDETSSRIAGILFEGQAETRNASLERFATQDDRQFDAVIGNVPFGLRGSLIKDDKPKLKTAEAYFCDTALDKCRDGGMVGLIVPTGVMDGKNNRRLREAMLRKGEFLGAQRLPNTAFEQSHTEVTTDIVWLRKRPDDVAGNLSHKTVTQQDLRDLGLWDDEFVSGGYFSGRGAANVFGSMEVGWRSKAGMGADITVEGSMNGVADSVAEFAPEQPKQVGMNDILTHFASNDVAHSAILGAAMTRPYANTGKAGDTKTVDGIVYVLQGEPLRWHRVDEVAVTEAVASASTLADRIDALIAKPDSDDRDSLAEAVQAWVDEHGLPSKNKDVLLAARQNKTLYRLVGAVNKDGSLSDLLRGTKTMAVKGDFESAVQSLLVDSDMVSVADIASRAGIDEEEALDHLYASPRYAMDLETGDWTLRDIYLSGLLWPKFDTVDAALSGELDDATRAKLEAQRADLMDAIEPKSLEDAFIEMNSAFLPTTMLSAFLTWRNQSGPDASRWTRDLDPVSVTFADGVYTIEGGNEYSLKSLDKYLNRTGLRKDDKPFIDNLNQQFKSWLCASDYREEAESLYNRTFQGFVEREYSNEPMVIPGLETEDLRDYQWGTLRWAMHSGKGIIASDVGLGKTAAALMLARSMKMTGQAERPLIVVPKSVLANWYEESQKWFPESRVLTIGGSFETQDDGTLKGKDDSKSERARKLQDMQQNDYDFIIMSEPAFGDLDLDPFTKKEFNDQDFWVQRGDSLGNAGDKRTKKIRESWEQARAQQERGEREESTYFNDLGVDAIIADEMHHQKNLVAARSRFGQQPKFLGGGGLSQRALDFNLKSRWILDQNDGKNVYGLTATPTKNSPIEIYAMISHVAPEAFERIGIRNVEDFLDRFARFENGMALDTKGEMGEAQITAGFQNMDELRELMQRYIRRRTAEDVGLELPERKDIPHMVDMDDAQQAAYSDLRELASKSQGADATGDAHIFSIMDKMNKAATDLSLLDSSYDAEKSPKYIACANEITKRVGDGGQIVFSDYVDAHEKIAQALARSGIPREQIGILNAKAASSASKRQNIANAYNKGKLKVVIGNTAVMGEGVNLQKKTSDIHHLDLPWEPASIQQRNGRGVRQGNTNEGVRVHNYLAKGSFDGYRLQSIMAKKDWQDAIWEGGNEVENLNKPEVSRDEMMIMLSADPDQARQAYEDNAKAKEARLVAGKTEEAAGRFVKYQSLSRSYGALKNKNTASAQRLKTRIDKSRANLSADPYFKAKAGLDMENAIVSRNGELLHAGAGVNLGDDGKYVVDSVDPVRQQVHVRKYADESSNATRTINASDLGDITAFHFDAEAEQSEIARKVANQPLNIENLSDLYKMPPAALQGRQADVQKFLWERERGYRLGLGGGRVAMVNKKTGELAAPEYFHLGGKLYSDAEYDFLLPGPDAGSKLDAAWKDAERRATFGVDTTRLGRRGSRTILRAVRRYDSILEHENPFNGVMLDVIGEGPTRHGEDTARGRRLRKELTREQLDRMKRADTFEAAAEEARPMGRIVDPLKGHSAQVALPVRALAVLWAKARQKGVLKDQTVQHMSRTDARHYAGTADLPVGEALLNMARNSGHDALVLAFVDSGLKHGGFESPRSALKALSKGYGGGIERYKAMKRLATKAGILETPIGDADLDGILSKRQHDPAHNAVTVGQHLARMMENASREEAA